MSEPPDCPTRSMGYRPRSLLQRLLMICLWSMPCASILAGCNSSGANNPILKTVEGMSVPLAAPDSATVVLIVSPQCRACRMKASELRSLRTAFGSFGLAVRTVLLGGPESTKNLVPLYGTDEVLVDSLRLSEAFYHLQVSPAIVMLDSRGTVAATSAQTVSLDSTSLVALAIEILRRTHGHQ